MKRCFLILTVLVALLLVVGGVAALQFDLSALPEPGRMETVLAPRASVSSCEGPAVEKFLSRQQIDQ